MVNKVILIGNLGVAPELRHTQNGTPVASLRLATSRRRKDQQTGEWIDETEWHRVTVWGKSAEFCNNYLTKGSRVYVEGRLQTRKWQDQNGLDRYTTEVVSENLQNLTPRNAGGGFAGDQGGFGGSQGGFSEPPMADEPFDTGHGGYGGSQSDSGTGDDVPF